MTFFQKDTYFSISTVKGFIVRSNMTEGKLWAVWEKTFVTKDIFFKTHLNNLTLRLCLIPLMIWQQSKSSRSRRSSSRKGQLVQGFSQGMGLTAASFSRFWSCNLRFISPTPLMTLQNVTMHWQCTEASLVLRGILQYLINIDLVKEHLSASSTYGEPEEVKTCEDPSVVLCLAAPDAADRVSADPRNKMKTGRSYCKFIFAVITYMLKKKKQIHLQVKVKSQVYANCVTFCDLGLIFITLTWVGIAGYLKYLFKKSWRTKAIFRGEECRNEKKSAYSGEQVK